ncbi:hypothetical protein RDV78_02245 [Bacillota bacterium LX-D]|nr:hypothetical protein [Bacillota bacterium LX-D]
MRKTKIKSKTKNKKTKVDKVQEIVINENLDTITDYLKQLLAAGSMSIEELKSKLNSRLPSYGEEKLCKNLYRSLEHNPCFIQQEDKWVVESRGVSANDFVYQWLSTVARPLSFGELRQVMEENNCPGLAAERELVWDGRFIRFKSGKWGLSQWHVIHKPGKADLKNILARIQAENRPLPLETVCQEIGDNTYSTELLQEAVARDNELMLINKKFIYSQQLYKNLLNELNAEDPLDLFRKAENSVLQEAELMLIIKDIKPNKRQCVLSSLDIKHGKISLTRRLEKHFNHLEPISYLNFKIQEQNVGIWYLADKHSLVGFKEWFVQNNIEPGQIVELSWEEGEPISEFSLSITGEREAEVYSEGLRIQKLNALCQEASEESLSLEKALVEVLEIYPEGLTLENLQMILQTMHLDTENLEEALQAYPFFQEASSNKWICNSSMKESYYALSEQLKLSQEEIETAQREAASALAEIQAIQQERDSLEDELIYIQNHHREEQALYQQKISDLAMKNEHWHLENTHLKSELEKMQVREENLTQEIEQQIQQLAVIRQERNKLKVKNEQLDNKLIQLKSQLNRILEEAESEIIRLKKLVQEKDNQIESLQYANQELERNLARVHEERRELKRKLSFWPVKLILSLFKKSYHERTMAH